MDVNCDSLLSFRKVCTGGHGLLQAGDDQCVYWVQPVRQECYKNHVDNSFVENGNSLLVEPCLAGMKL